MHDQGQTCPSCCSSKYSNPQLKLMVNTCGHSLCENCVEVLFVRGSGLCVRCKTPLRKANFRYQLFEDPLVQTEVELRKKILSDFNKREEDFDSLEEYDLYLEKIEDIIYNLMNDVDIENTKRYIEVYKRENKDIIKKNRLRPSTSLAYYNAELERETMLREQRQREDAIHLQQKRTEAIQLLGQLNSAPRRPNNDLHGQQQTADTVGPPVTPIVGARQLILPSAAMSRPTPTALPPLPPPSAFGSVNTPASVLPLRQTPSTGFVVPPSAMSLGGGWNPAGGAMAPLSHLNTWSPVRGLSTPRQPDTVLIPTRSQSGRLSKPSTAVAATVSAGATGPLTSGRHKLDPTSTNATTTVYTHQPYQFDSGGPPVPNCNAAGDKRWSELLRVYHHAVIRQLPGNKTNPAVATARWGDVKLEPKCEEEGEVDPVESEPQYLGASCQLPAGACGISPGVFLERCLQEARCALFM